MKLETPKGMSDSHPQDEIVMQDILARLKKIFELYGFSPLDTPAVEKFEVLSSKYAGGEEILKETFGLGDQGKRKLGLRYDLTVPLARFVGMNPKLKLPFKRYQIGKVWRDGPVASSRYREFIQCDVDVVGASNSGYDAELLFLASRFFRELGLKHEIRLNNRKILNGILEYIGVAKEKKEPAILAVDKLEKLGRDEVVKELREKGIPADKAARLLELTQTGLIDIEKGLGEAEGIREMKEVLRICEENPDYSGNVVFDASLARGLSYYTGSVFEVFLKGSSVKSAVCAGGRYDRLIGSILGSGDFPAVGISFGLSRIFDAVKKSSGKKTVTQAFIIPIGTADRCIGIAEELRNAGIAAEMDLAGAGPSKNLRYANSLGIPIVVFIGEDELASGKAKIRDMRTGIESLAGLGELAKAVGKKLGQ